MLERVVELANIDQLMQRFEDRIEDGFLNGKRYLLVDRDTKFCESFRDILQSEDVEQKYSEERDGGARISAFYKCAARTESERGTQRIGRGSERSGFTKVVLLSPRGRRRSTLGLGRRLHRRLPRSVSTALGRGVFRSSPSYPLVFHFSTAQLFPPLPRVWKFKGP